MSATRPAWKRSRRRSSSACRSCGGRSEVRTIWRPPSCSALKVWKNSSSVFVLRSRNWTSSTSSTSTWRKRALKCSVLPSVERAEELVGERLAGCEADGEAGVVGEQQARDRAEQVRLADAGRAADEQRVVGLAGSSATVSAAACASRLESPITNWSNVSLGLPSGPGSAGWVVRVRSRRFSGGARGARRAPGARRAVGACAAADELDEQVRGDDRGDARPGAPGRSARWIQRQAWGGASSSSRSSLSSSAVSGASQML